MKTFEDIVDQLWKPSKVKTTAIFMFKSKDWVAHKNTILRSKLSYSAALSKPFYGKDINEPIVKVCKRILKKPNRFHLVDIKTSVNYNFDYYMTKYTVDTWKVVQDKDTQQKFVRGNNGLTIPSFLTVDEEKLLKAVLNIWYEDRKVCEAEKSKLRDQRRKDKFRQEMIELYKDL